MCSYIDTCVITTLYITLGTFDSAQPGYNTFLLDVITQNVFMMESHGRNYTTSRLYLSGHRPWACDKSALVLFHSILPAIQLTKRAKPVTLATANDPTSKPSAQYDPPDLGTDEEPVYLMN